MLRVLIKDGVTMQGGVDGNQATLIPVKAELSGPGQDWLATWAMLRTRGVSSEDSSFFFKLPPTLDKINRITREMAVCKVCKDTPVHAFFDCLPWKDTSALLLSCVDILVQGVSPIDILTLNFLARVEESDCLPTLVLIATE